MCPLTSNRLHDGGGQITMKTKFYGLFVMYDYYPASSRCKKMFYALSERYTEWIVDKKFDFAKHDFYIPKVILPEPDP